MRRKAVPSIFCAMMGCIFLVSILSRPRLADLRSVDVISLVAAGACIGVGLLGAVIGWKASRQTPNRE